MKNNGIRGTGKPASIILTNLREAIEAGEILVKVATTQAGYKETQLIDKATGYKLIPEHVVPVIKQKEIFGDIIKVCAECKKVIARDEVYISYCKLHDDQCRKCPWQGIIYYHNKCFVKKGTTSDDF